MDFSSMRLVVSASTVKRSGAASGPERFSRQILAEERKSGSRAHWTYGWTTACSCSASRQMLQVESSSTNVRSVSQSASALRFETLPQQW